MTTKKRTFWNLFILFELIFIIKAGLSLLLDGPFIFSDESCVIQRAIYFINNFKFETCENLTTLPSGDPQPLYSILISPIYYFTYGITAYKIATILNSLLIASLVFPLYGICKKFIKNTKYIFLIIIVTLFLSQIMAYEKTVMTESLFVVINIWLLHFYLKSFSKKRKTKIVNKLLAVILSILATLTRPFGFIVPVALAVNEIAVAKNKKKTLLFFLPFAIILTFLALFILLDHIINSIFIKINFLSILENWKYIFIALKNQINSFSIATALIPIIVFFTYINKKDSPHLKNIKYFLITLIFLNFAISAQHQFGYYIKNMDPVLITRYINLSIILIIFFSLIFLKRYKKFSFNKTNISIIILLLVSLFFFKDIAVKHSLNLDLSFFYESRTHLFGEDLVESKKILGTVFFPITFILFVLLVANKRKILIATLISIFIILSIHSTIWVINYAVNSEFIDFFEKKETDISFIVKNERINNLNKMFQLYATTKNKLYLILVDHKENGENINTLNIEEFENSKHFQKSEYAITEYEIPDLTKLYKIGDQYIYKIE
ncbi:hypothetical protein GF366_05035 [Candidatus Peregrinibacteria bacterium]|nr:hypothetical protein [Candidatus Peregrinibacteria bacterium]